MNYSIFTSSVLPAVFLLSVHYNAAALGSPRPTDNNIPYARELTSAIAAEAYLMVLCEYDANITVDGELLGEVAANQFKRFTIFPGQHMILVETKDGAMRWEGQLHTPENEQTLLKPQLAPSDVSVGIPGIFKDPADQKEYKTVKIGNLEWFAENYSRDILGNNAPNKKPANISSYGRLYKSNYVSPPNGWRIPTEDDYAKLLKMYANPYEALVGGKSGFKIVFAGIVDIDKYALGFDSLAAFWTATPGPEIKDLGGKKHPSTKFLIVNRAKGTVEMSHAYQSKFFSVRFVRDLK
ncbi:major paralogous domain-containing protein [Flavobacterium anhuiense]|uniref:Major paralogous domain-containing protein n=1 Tax=Flavobacterium anhuiense TaxID=459526 RepID=A0ABY0LWN9_9FLAO|nr:FISUMP domain-containing protein [Flavobacterium anhuiense]SCY74123.1 major paralogous domain-containing protein [Flavobacterium anhuiense]